MPVLARGEEHGVLCPCCPPVRDDTHKVRHLAVTGGTVQPTVGRIASSTESQTSGPQHRTHEMTQAKRQK
jgi:hypothetical protein